ncbi:MAG: hypothetical protein JWP26_4222 [Devosia sp.]|uniref:hypothetical protein n=1 Tax=Devosia sp. TaxID=1871048 RepID=UPI0026392803|nr:hypothetical protein [Devosia sp.]MDB5589252.1 hypothetical protein [Devosia sp.]
MREVYYRVNQISEAPEWGAMVRIWWEAELPMAYVSAPNEETSSVPDDPDLTLFRAGLLRAQHDLLGVFVWLEDDALWREEWGDLVQ